MNKSSPPSDTFAAFAREVHHLHASWTAWRRLFWRRCEDGETPEASIAAGTEAYRVTGAASELFFVYARGYMADGIVASICRLCDPPTQGKYRNLSVDTVVAELDFSTTPNAEFFFLQNRTALLDCVNEDGGIRQLRNKLLSHFDLDVALGTLPLPDPDMDKIRIAVGRLVKIAFNVQRHRDHLLVALGDHACEPPRSVEIAWHAEVDRLVTVLARGVDAT